MLFPELGERLADVTRRIAAAVARGGHGQAVSLVAVTKTHGPEALREAWAAGITDIGENRVQEALGKMAEFDEPMRWHLIGHLQRNKVRALDRFFLFHALDSLRLADAVNEAGRGRSKPVDVLVQVNPGREETKGGFHTGELQATSERLASMPGIRVLGVMTIARLGAGESELRSTFAAARASRHILAEAGHPATELSMGMSSDFEVAVEEGATLVRIGSYLFGARDQ